MIRKFRRNAGIRKAKTMSGTKVSISNGELPGITDALGVLGREKFGITFSFKIKRLLVALKSPTEIYSDARNDVIEEFAKRNKDGEKITSADGAVVEMNEGWLPKMIELNSLEAAMVEPITAQELIAACEAINVSVSGQMLMELGKLLVDDFDEPPVVKNIVPPVEERLNGVVPEAVTG